MVWCTAKRAVPGRDAAGIADLAADTTADGDRHWGVRELQGGQRRRSYDRHNPRAVGPGAFTSPFFCSANLCVPKHLCVPTHPLGEVEGQGGAVRRPSHSAPAASTRGTIAPATWERAGRLVAWGPLLRSHLPKMISAEARSCCTQPRPLPSSLPPASPQRRLHPQTPPRRDMAARLLAATAPQPQPCRAGPATAPHTPAVAAARGPLHVRPARQAGRPAHAHLVAPSRWRRTRTTIPTVIASPQPRSPFHYPSPHPLFVE